MLLGSVTLLVDMVDVECCLERWSSPAKVTVDDSLVGAIADLPVDLHRCCLEQLALDSKECKLVTLLVALAVPARVLAVLCCETREQALLSALGTAMGGNMTLPSL